MFFDKEMGMGTKLLAAVRTTTQSLQSGWFPRYCTPFHFSVIILLQVATGARSYITRNLPGTVSKYPNNGVVSHHVGQPKRPNTVAVVLADQYLLSSLLDNVRAATTSPFFCSAAAVKTEKNN